MSVQVKLNKGGDIKLQGVANRVISEVSASEVYAVKPTDFYAVVPKLILREGAKVKVGTVLFFDKEKENIKFSSPVSGEIVEIVRGERRKILEIRIKSDGQNAAESFPTLDTNTASKEEITEQLLNSGLWPVVKQRPFDLIANPEDSPKAVFVSAFDSSPLAPDYDFVLEGNEDAFQKGLDVLAKFSASGVVNLNVPTEKEVRFNVEDTFSYSDATGKVVTIDYKTASNGAGISEGNKALSSIIEKYSTPSDKFTNANSIELGEIEGIHPAGNVGIQIHKINPINKGEVIWTVNVQDVVKIGRFFLNGTLSFEKIIALTGSEVKTPQYYKVIAGAPLSSIIANNIKTAEETPRFIGGNVLTGTKLSKDAFIGFYDNQITVIPEGDQYDMLGWAVPIQPNKLSFSKTLWSWITPGKAYRLNTNNNGEQRAFVVTGQYEQFLPMNIYPVQLLKACLVEDIDMMEGLGIYEVAPEDLALCEFSCTSKIPVQHILRQGLDLVKTECS